MHDLKPEAPEKGGCWKAASCGGLQVGGNLGRFDGAVCVACEGSGVITSVENRASGW